MSSHGVLYRDIRGHSFVFPVQLGAACGQGLGVLSHSKSAIDLFACPLQH